MKKYFKLLFALALPLAVFTACNDDDDPNPGPNPTETNYASAIADEYVVNLAVTEGTTPIYTNANVKVVLSKVGNAENKINIAISEFEIEDLELTSLSTEASLGGTLTNVTITTLSTRADITAVTGSVANKKITLALTATIDGETYGFVMQGEAGTWAPIVDTDLAAGIAKSYDVTIVVDAAQEMDPIDTKISIVRESNNSVKLTLEGFEFDGVPSGEMDIAVPGVSLSGEVGNVKLAFDGQITLEELGGDPLDTTISGSIVDGETVDLLLQLTFAEIPIKVTIKSTVVEPNENEE